MTSPMLIKQFSYLHIAALGIENISLLIVLAQRDAFND